ncbi:MAG: hypothetical protein IJ302_08590, partial [Clostridia bacterium]|nr:hypothetical protein [Clostridia bacterium]
LEPSAQRLLDNFVMEMRGYDSENPDEVAAFQEELDALNLLDSYVQNIQATVADQVIQPVIDGVQKAIDGTDAAIEGVPQAQQAVTTAVDGVAQAQSVVDLIKSELLSQDMFTGSSTSDFVKSVIISEIEKVITDDMMISFGFEVTDANRTMLAEEVYYVACIYYDEINVNGGTEETANKLAIIEIIRFKLAEAEGYSEEEAQNTAELAYNLNAIYQSEGEDAAVKAALASQVGEETAEQALQLYELYQSYGGAENHAEARYNTIIAAICSVGGYEQTVAVAMYNIHAAATDGDDATFPTEEDVICVLATEGITEDQAKSIYACYKGGLDGDYENADVRTTMIVLMVIGMEMTAEDAAENYDLYVVYKRLPHTFCIVANTNTIYVDALLNKANNGGINEDEIAAQFVAGELLLELTEEQKNDPELVKKYQEDSSLILMYLRFLNQSGVFIHPSDKGQASMASEIKEDFDRLEEISYDENETLSVYVDENTVLLSLGDSVATDSTAADGEVSYGKRVAELLGIAEGNYYNEAEDGMRVNDLRSLLDTDYNGDAYTAEKFSASSVEHLADADIILVNLGAANLGFALTELLAYTQNNGQTYPMTFADIEIIGEENGSDIDNMIALVNGHLTGEGSNESVTQLMLVLESYGYGMTLFAESFEAVMDDIRTANPDAAIVLYGQYDLLGDSYYNDGSASL